MIKGRKKIDTQVEIMPVRIQEGRISLRVLGKSPLIYNAMSLKSKQGLLFPPGRKTMGDKAMGLKHNPIEEYRASIYRRKEDEEGPTRLLVPAVMFKNCLRNAALRVGGVKKTEIGQLVWVEDTYVDMYGTPEIFMSVVRSADINRTPDIRTRAILPTWGCTVNMTYIQPQVSAASLFALAVAAGKMIGIGDFRQEKGAGAFGRFDVMGDEDDPRFVAVQKQGMAEQDDALQTPGCYDAETEELLSWFDAEIRKLDPGTSKRVSLV